MKAHSETVSIFLNKYFLSMNLKNSIVGFAMVLLTTKLFSQTPIVADIGTVASEEASSIVQASDGGFDKEGERRQLDIALGEALFGAFDMLEKSRDIGFFNVRDMHKLLAREGHLFGDLASEESLRDALDRAVSGDLDVFGRRGR